MTDRKKISIRNILMNISKHDIACTYWETRECNCKIGRDIDEVLTGDPDYYRKKTRKKRKDQGSWQL